jgi:hypothetical protein
VIIGGRNEAQFRDSLAAADLILTAEERAGSTRVSQPPLLYRTGIRHSPRSDRLGSRPRVPSRHTLDA